MLQNSFKYFVAGLTFVLLRGAIFTDTVAIPALRVRLGTAAPASEASTWEAFPATPSRRVTDFSLFGIPRTEPAARGARLPAIEVQLLAPENLTAAYSSDFLTSRFPALR